MTAVESDLATRVTHAAHLLRDSGPGVAAELRRLDAGAADRWRSAAFYRLAAAVAPDALGHDDAERRWAMVFSGMARLPHRHGVHPGRALAEAGYAERRLARLLSADDARLGDELRAAVAFLAAKQGEGVDWIALTALALSRSGSDGYDGCRRRLAEDYFRTLEQKKKG